MWISPRGYRRQSNAIAQKMHQRQGKTISNYHKTQNPKYIEKNCGL